VVGAGISGSIAAEALADDGLAVIIADRRGPAEGSTAASTALLQYEIDTPLIELTRQLGPHNAVRAWRRSRSAVDALLDRAAELGLDAGIARRETLYLAGDRLDGRGLRAQPEARRSAGFEVRYFPPRQTAARFGIDRAAIHSAGNAVADPIRLTLGFLDRARAAGARLTWPLDITRVDPHARGVTARADDGSVIRARHLVFATGYELAAGVPRAGHRVVSTWVIATPPQPENLWPGPCLIWEASDPYLYARAGPRGEVICGGEDECIPDEQQRDRLIPAKTRAIERKLAALLPNLDPAAELAWTGNFGTSDTGLPVIGPVPRMPNCSAVLGYGGNGITFSMLAAQIIRAHIAGRPDPDADLFAFTDR
jgi:glycine/D-amino acid oxidase-like deaminating enzyme